MTNQETIEQERNERFSELASRKRFNKAKRTGTSHEMRKVCDNLVYLYDELFLQKKSKVAFPYYNGLFIKEEPYLDFHLLTDDTRINKDFHKKVPIWVFDMVIKSSNHKSEEQLQKFTDEIHDFFMYLEPINASLIYCNSSYHIPRDADFSKDIEVQHWITFEIREFGIVTTKEARQNV